MNSKSVNSVKWRPTWCAVNGASPFLALLTWIESERFELTVFWYRTRGESLRIG